MKKIINILGRFSIAMLILILAEAMASFGTCFMFEKYPWWVWVLQGMLVMITIMFTMWWCEEDEVI